MRQSYDLEILQGVFLVSAPLAWRSFFFILFCRAEEATRTYSPACRCIQSRTRSDWSMKKYLRLFAHEDHLDGTHGDRADSRAQDRFDGLLGTLSFVCGLEINTLVGSSVPHAEVLVVSIYPLALLLITVVDVVETSEPVEAGDEHGDSVSPAGPSIVELEQQLHLLRYLLFVRRNDEIRGLQPEPTTERPVFERPPPCR
mmetsp:Transcript_12233/g.50540  ORF Transcript_12233/g.50540 Transcript_12233/m.50540 type:complete len:200 (-) Transcript_12233:334-933(-)